MPSRPDPLRHWLHGEAVGRACAWQRTCPPARLIDGAALERTRRLIADAGLPTVPPPDLSAERFLALMAVDKKVLDGHLRLVLCAESVRPW